VAYVAGYQGAPISHLMDVLADAQDILRIGHPNHEIRSRFSKQVSAR
jgi:TPP-dependent indolepyruvate ferredoxin oxidoreductase alpha subunit